jgi:hypothetical protein
MLRLPFGLRLHDRRRDELVVVRRRRAYLSPSHGFANRKSRNPIYLLKIREAAGSEGISRIKSGNALRPVVGNYPSFF